MSQGPCGPTAAVGPWSGFLKVRHHESMPLSLALDHIHSTFTHLSSHTQGRCVHEFSALPRHPWESWKRLNERLQQSSLLSIIHFMQTPTARSASTCVGAQCPPLPTRPTALGTSASATPHPFPHCALASSRFSGPLALRLTPMAGARQGTGTSRQARRARGEAVQCVAGPLAAAALRCAVLSCSPAAVISCRRLIAMDGCRAVRAMGWWCPWRRGGPAGTIGDADRGSREVPLQRQGTVRVVSRSVYHPSENAPSLVASCRMRSLDSSLGDAFSGCCCGFNDTRAAHECAVRLLSTRSVLQPSRQYPEGTTSYCVWWPAGAKYVVVDTRSIAEKTCGIGATSESARNYA